SIRFLLIFFLRCAHHRNLHSFPTRRSSDLLAIRPNEKGRVNTGRETFILPVDWSGEWPVFQGGMEPLKPSIEMPRGAENKTGTDDFFPSGNFTFVDNFEGTGLDDRWIALRGPREKFIRKSKSGLVIKPFNVNIKA